MIDGVIFAKKLQDSQIAVRFRTLNNSCELSGNVFVGYDHLRKEISLSYLANLFLILRSNCISLLLQYSLAQVRAVRY